MSNKIQILALDQASNCGWCCAPDIHGVWDFRTKKDESSGMKGLRFKAKLREVIDGQKIGLVVYERIAGQHANSIIHSAKFVAIIEMMCEEMGIQYKAYSAGEIKRFATGRGNANKLDMVKAAQEKFGYQGKSDDEADAICLYHLAIQDFKYL